VALIPKQCLILFLKKWKEKYLKPIGRREWGKTYVKYGGFKCVDVINS